MKINGFYARLTALFLAMALLFTLTGCTSFGGDVQTQLRPPQATGQQGEIEAALNQYLTSNLTQDNYVMKYPQSGDYRSAFLVEDLDGDGNAEAVAFYRPGTESGYTHINLLHQSNGKWQSMNDYESSGTDIECVCFGDMDGDGVRELFVCWDMYSSRTYQLSMYGINGNRVTERFTASCTRMTVGDLTGDGREDCLLFNVGTEALTATLWSMQNGVMVEQGYGTVDSYVQRIRTVQMMPLTEMRNGVFLDCVKNDNLVTELVYWDGTRLVTPLYDEMLKSNTLSVRPGVIPSGDVDEDGRWEWPTCTLLDGFANEANTALRSTCWKTTFWSWDTVAGQPVQKFTCIYNSDDGYYLLLDDKLANAVTTSYDPNTRTLSLRSTEPEHADEELMAVRTTLKGAEPPAETEEDTRKFVSLATSDTTAYTVWYPTESVVSLNMETIRYMLTLL